MPHCADVARELAIPGGTVRRSLLQYCLILVAVTATGCVRSTIEVLSPSRYPPTFADSVTVFISVADVDAQGLAFERVAMLFIRATAEFTQENAIMRRAREDAAKLGANGIILGGAREPGTWGTDRQERIMAVRTRPKDRP
jgi:hypothetical protein